MRPESFSKNRLFKLIIFVLVGALLPSLASFIKGGDWLEIAVSFGVLLIVDIIIVLFIENQRLTDSNPLGKGDNLTLFLVVMLIEVVAVSAYVFAPPFFRAPVFLAVVARALGKNPRAYIASIYCVIATVITSNSIYEALVYAILILSGIILCQFASKENRILVLILTTATSFAVNASMYFLQNKTLDSIILGIILGISLISGFIIIFLTPVCDGFAPKQFRASIDALLDEENALRRSLREFTNKDYEHALNVSKIAKNVALVIGADEKLCEAGAFFYRIGILEGEPYIDNAVKLAEEHCFPERLTDILYEYNGLVKKPSTIESAIVQICDCVVSKYELLGTDTFQSDWNREVIVMQTMNEKSQAGLYDESGLSMNMFIKVRDAIIAEELLS